MNLKKKFLSFLIIALFFITGCGKISIPTNANTAFRNFTLCFFQQEVASNTINLHYSLQEPAKYGIVESPITLGSYDFNEASTLASIENWEVALHKFSPSSLSEENKLTYDILSHYFETLRTDVSYYLYEEPLSPVTGIHAQLPVLLAEYQFTDAKDAETYLALLETLPNYFASLTRFEQQKSSAGLFMSDAVADEVIAQCNAFVAMGDENYLLSTFEERVKGLKHMTSEEQSAFIEKNKQILSTSVLPAYESLAMSLAALKGTGTNTQGLCKFPKGTDYYSHLVASETGSSRSISELKELIQAQILTDLLDSQQVLKENPTILEETDSITESPETILQTLEAKISNAFPSSADVNVNVKYVPSALEDYLSPAFYLIPAIDNFNENTIYINQGHSLTDINLFTTLAHEGYPGHLYQTTYFANTNPDPVRNLLDYSGYVEGWATYAEMCSYYLSALTKPHATLLQKNNSIILGLYAAADIGIHYDVWTLQDTVKHFAAYGIDDEATIAEIYEYILGDPANYLKYYVGYLEILELKRDYMNQHGNDFSQKDFHKELLAVGPAPFEVVRKYMID
ncbi:MAG: DUF885 domain-containing protein [Tyzzerella sp.]|nr:DUF885 domain-containing protein [Tyzzerella sp.]